MHLGTSNRKKKEAGKKFYTKLGFAKVFLEEKGAAAKKISVIL
jgi:hypothetical protein